MTEHLMSCIKCKRPMTNRGFCTKIKKQRCYCLSCEQSRLVGIRKLKPKQIHNIEIVHNPKWRSSTYSHKGHALREAKMQELVEFIKANKHRYISSTDAMNAIGMSDQWCRLQMDRLAGQGAVSIYNRDGYISRCALLYKWR
jgi:hypothetical protein